LLDDYHPANDEYMRSIDMVQKRIMQHCANMKPKQVEVIKLHHTGKTNQDIAEITGYSEGNVSVIINSDNGKRLKALLCYYQQGVEGPNKAQRMNMLWRMAIDNERERPTVAKECIAELNRMDNAAQQLELTKQGNDNRVQIIINNEILPKGALD